jgi:hypothetical protein
MKQMHGSITQTVAACAVIVLLIATGSACFPAVEKVELSNIVFYVA